MTRIPISFFIKFVNYDKKSVVYFSEKALVIFVALWYNCYIIQHIML